MKSLGLYMTVVMLGFSLVACGETSASSQSKSAEQRVASSESDGLFPAFKVKDFAGNEINLADYRGKVVILDLFATWCPPCRQEIPHFVELQDDYADDLAIIGLSYDQTGAEKVQAFAKEMKINYDLFWGSQEIAAFVNLRGIPHTLVIDRQGKVRGNFVGYRDKSVFEEAIKPLL